jgi:Ser/Thr protein kinase RdoA (MazF antagonist)
MPVHDDDYLTALLAGLPAELPQWQLPETTQLSLLSLSENAIFLAVADGRRMILRVHRPHYHTAAEIGSELAWIAAIQAERIVRTPRPIPRRDGALLGTVACGSERRHVVGFDFMDGREPVIADDLTGWFTQLGATSARLHRHSRAWQRPAGFVRKHWNFQTTIGDNPHWGDWRAGLGLDDAGRALLTRTVAVIEQKLALYGCGADRFGLVHGDLRLANLLVDGDRLGVIDFDDCGFSWFMYDFAAAVSFHEHEPAIPSLQAAWLAGYRGVAEITPADEAMLPVFVMLRRILLTAWIASHAETPTAIACGPAYTEGTLDLARAFLARHG